MMNCCGLVTGQKLPVPLKSISVDVQVKGHVATVTSTLQYVNEEDRPLEALFVFPLPADAAVCHFSAKIGEQEIVAELKEKQTARDQYDDAVSSGQQAFLLEESEESSDVFKLSVGCLSPGQNAAISITYITELSVQADHALRFCLPTVLNPRYTPAGSAARIVSEISSVRDSVPYTLTLSVHVSSPNPISKLESKCTLDPLVFLNSDHTLATVNLSSGHKFDKDVELFVYYENTHQPTAIVEAGVTTAQAGSLMSDPVVMISLYPEFPKEVMSSLATQGEFVFVIDRSGSMDLAMHPRGRAEKRIRSAKETLILLLKSLPMGCYFNIYGFGSSYESFFPQSVVYNQDTMDQALKKVNEMSANMGGTEILQPLRHIYSQPCYPEHPRQLFVFTDGEVGNTKEVLDLVRNHSQSHRCFSFGIGEGASTALITGLAREGCGHAQFISGTDRMQPKVMQSLRFALQPVVNKISVQWKVPDGITVDTLSPPINVIFQGQRSLIYAQIKGQSSESSEGSVMIQYNLKDQSVTNQLHFCLKPPQTEDTGLMIHRLAARSLIGCLEQEERAGGAEVESIKSKMVKLSVEAGVNSVHTAFIAINKHNRETVKGPLIQRRIPTQGRYLATRMCVMSGASPQRRPIAMKCRMAPAPVSEQICCVESSLPDEDLDSDDDHYQPPMAVRPMKMMCPMNPPPGSAGMMPLMRAGLANSSQKKIKAIKKLSTAPEPQKDSFLQLVSLQKASGCWELNSALAQLFGKTEDELTNQKPAQVDGSVWAALLALIWLYGYKIQQQDEWQFVAMKASSWIRSQNVGGLSQCVCDGNVLLRCHVSKETLGI
ncbi:von Willebrand factor A domain-containing protein 5A [Triplophysa tibetana]|uniref:von Willebrand factor A domain-containing protein 5A n=1 Tax=Triplophysa tibetana TaxID=1572043 RepID=A0A5A9PR37_9TELE|nr:von Willebrand factor A domain-containing protein 5A [Triplophysa tibetana]